MSRRAETLTWERARVGKSELLMLVKIADLADDDGRNCWAEVPHLARECRASARGAQYILHRLEQLGEIEIEHNDEGREISLRGGRRFRPKWFIHVRCVSAWEAYQLEPKKRAKIADSVGQFRRGRPRRESAKIAHSSPNEKRKVCAVNSQESDGKFAKTGSAYKEGSVNDPLVEQEQGAAPPAPAKKTEDPDANFSVITKLAHEVFDLHEQTPDFTQADTEDAVERRCLALGIAFWPGDVVQRAISAACYQRARAGKPAVLPGNEGEAAWRLERAGRRSA